MLLDNASLIVVAALLGLVLLSQVVLWSVLFQVVKQQGRILLRLDDIASHSTELPVLNPSPAPAERIGPEVGHRLANFRLPSLTGNQVSLEDYRGQRVLLVHWSPTCGFCELIAPDLAEHQVRLRENGVQLVLVSRGDPVANLQLAEEHGLRCPVLTLPDGDSLDVFRHQGTPVACLVDEQGQVARPLAVGAGQVPTLVRELAEPNATKRRLPGERPLSESHIIRDGLKPGTPAPAFTLPDSSGEEVALERYRGQRTLLVFSDPHCGPCEALAPHLSRLSGTCRAAGLQLLMVSRGDAEENRQKVRRHGFDFPVALQQHWEVSRAFGIFATPVAFLINEQGVIEREVAQGVDAILGLIQEQLDARKEQVDGLAIR
jgi:peroxiredoxin